MSVILVMGYIVSLGISSYLSWSEQTQAEKKQLHQPPKTNDFLIITIIVINQKITFNSK